MEQASTPSLTTYNTTVRRAVTGIALCMIAPFAAGVALTIYLPELSKSPLRFVLIATFLVVALSSAGIGLTLWVSVENAELDIKRETIKPCATPGCTRSVFFDPTRKSYIHEGSDPLHCAAELSGTPFPRELRRHKYKPNHI